MLRAIRTRHFTALPTPPTIHSAIPASKRPSKRTIMTSPTDSESSNSLLIACPTCSTRYRVPMSWAGKEVKCQKCLSPILVFAFEDDLHLNEQRAATQPAPTPQGRDLHASTPAPDPGLKSPMGASAIHMFKMAVNRLQNWPTTKRMTITALATITLVTLSVIWASTSKDASVQKETSGGVAPPVEIPRQIPPSEPAPSAAPAESIHPQPDPIPDKKPEPPPQMAWIDLLGSGTGPFLRPIAPNFCYYTHHGVGIEPIPKNTDAPIAGWFSSFQPQDGHKEIVLSARAKSAATIELHVITSKTSRSRFIFPIIADSEYHRYRVSGNQLYIDGTDAILLEPSDNVLRTKNTPIPDTQFVSFSHDERVAINDQFSGPPIGTYLLFHGGDSIHVDGWWLGSLAQSPAWKHAFLTPETTPDPASKSPLGKYKSLGNNMLFDPSWTPGPASEIHDISIAGLIYILRDLRPRLQEDLDMAAKIIAFIRTFGTLSASTIDEVERALESREYSASLDRIWTKKQATPPSFLTALAGSTSSNGTVSFSQDPQCHILCMDILEKSAPRRTHADYGFMVEHNPGIQINWQRYGRARAQRFDENRLTIGDSGPWLCRIVANDSPYKYVTTSGISSSSTGRYKYLLLQEPREPATTSPILAIASFLPIQDDFELELEADGATRLGICPIDPRVVPPAMFHTGGTSKGCIPHEAKRQDSTGRVTWTSMRQITDSTGKTKDTPWVPQRFNLKRKNGSLSLSVNGRQTKDSLKAPWDCYLAIEVPKNKNESEAPNLVCISSMKLISPEPSAISMDLAADHIILSQNTGTTNDIALRFDNNASERTFRFFSNCNLSTSDGPLSSSSASIVFTADKSGLHQKSGIPLNFQRQSAAWFAVIPDGHNSTNAVYTQPKNRPIPSDDSLMVDSCHPSLLIAGQPTKITIKARIGNKTHPVEWLLASGQGVVDYLVAMQIVSQKTMDGTTIYECTATIPRPGIVSLAYVPSGTPPNRRKDLVRHANFPLFCADKSRSQLINDMLLNARDINKDQVISAADFDIFALGNPSESGVP